VLKIIGVFPNKKHDVFSGLSSEYSVKKYKKLISYLKK